MREAASDDEARVVSLWRECGLVAPYNDPVADFRLAVSGACSCVLVAEDDAVLLGSVMAGSDGHRGWLYYVAVVARSRGRGIGRRLVESGERWLGSRGVAKVQLIVRESNVGVTGFYERLGYETLPRVLMGRWLSR